MYLVLLVRVGLLIQKIHYQLFLYSGLGEAGGAGESEVPGAAAAVQCVHLVFEQASTTFPLRALRLSNWARCLLFPL